MIPIIQIKLKNLNKKELNIPKKEKMKQGSKDDHSHKFYGLLIPNKLIHHNYIIVKKS